MVASLGDSYTYFLTPEEFQESKDELHGTFEGIGAELGLKQGQIVIVSPLKDSPAEKAGLLASDIILKVDGKKTDNWTLHEAVNKIRGPHGKKVTLTVFRQSIQDEKTISVVRDKISIKFVELTYENDVAIVELSRFGDDTVELWNKSVDEIASKWKQGKVKGMVLDLRGNPGGFLDGAVYISSEFLHEGDVVVKQEYSDKKQDIYRADREGKLVGIPLTILINGGSASASEIVAGALRDNKKATLVGEKSFGKGTVQQVFDLSNNAGVHITISRWILPKGDWIHENGIKPNIEVKNEDDLENTLTRDKDKQLDKAIEVLKK
jgi:carboxyl-terminal processing protease